MTSEQVSVFEYTLRCWLQLPCRQEGVKQAECLFASLLGLFVCVQRNLQSRSSADSNPESRTPFIYTPASLLRASPVLWPNKQPVLPPCPFYWVSMSTQNLFSVQGQDFRFLCIFLYFPHFFFPNGEGGFALQFLPQNSL